jgi:uncharacterized Ntn-hydrolase superfamily protein
MRLVCATLMVAIASGSGEARATYSIVASDSAKKLVGSAGASCVPYEVIRIYRAAPGRGALVAQAYFDDPAMTFAAERLAEGDKPAQILPLITDVTKYPNAARMQYGIVDTRGGVATFTGPLALSYAGAQSRSRGDEVFAWQGNVLTSASVLAQIGDGIERDACDLPARLMNAFEAASNNGEGDARCTPDGIPAKSAYLEVISEDGPLVRISLPDVSPENPIVKLREAFNVWRTDHPCDASVASSGSASAATGSSGGESTDGDGCQCHLTERKPDAHWPVIAIALALSQARRVGRRRPIARVIATPPPRRTNHV